MSTKIMWLISHKNWDQNSSFTKEIVSLLRRKNLNPKQIAKDLRIPTEKVRNWFAKEKKAPRTVRFQERFLVQIGTKIKSVPVAEVAYFMADGKYLMLYTHEGGGYILDQTMAALEERLDPQIFFRINRKFIVGFSAIKEMIRYSNNRIKIGLSPLPPENIEAIVSADRIREFRDWLNR